MSIISDLLQDTENVRWTQTIIPTLKEVPSDAVVPSHKLLVRAGFIRQLGSGAYTYLPFGLRSLRKAEAIVREEMNRSGAIEVLMPALQPIELWKETGRYETFGNLLMQLKLSGDRHVALGPTHEEVVTDLARDLINSYRQLPITLYQIQTKFRDEPRPRFGVLRTREFLMKDAYSFSKDVDQLNHAYDSMYEAYCRIFDRCGVPYVIVEAESGPIGGDSSHEFMVPSSTGEDKIIQDPISGYAANQERAEIGAIAWPAPADPNAPAAEKKSTPHKRTIQEVAEFLGVKPEETAKLLVFSADEKVVGILIRGDHEANEAKVRRAFGAQSLELATAEQILKATGAPMGFLGPIDSKIPLLIDPSAAAMPLAVVGGNEVDVHYVNVVPGRDFPLSNVVDVRNAEAGDPSPKGGAPMIITQGIEIGHVFKLGTKYSAAMNANYLDENGKQQHLIMGCYGIGVNRILAAAVEASYDENGIIWPMPIAPYEVVVIPLAVNKPEIMDLANKFAEALTAAGADVIIDDRDQRPGFKFKDADLIGFPLRVVIGEKGVAADTIEVKWRAGGESFTVPVADGPAQVAAKWRERHDAHSAFCKSQEANRAVKGRL